MDELDRVVVAAPCPISWEKMPGNERVRYCSSCSKNVYNLSDMNSKDAQAFLEVNGTSQCIRLFRRQDGKIMTDNCPVGLRAIRNKYKMAIRVLAGCAASLLAFIPNFRNICSAQEATPYDGEPSLKTPVKPTTKKDDKTNTGKAETAVPGPMMSAGLIALPPKSPTSNKQVMVGGDVCGNTKTNATPKPNNVKVEMGNFEMGKVAAPQRDNSAINAVQNKFERDSKSYELYKKAQASEAAGQFLLAQTQYQEAIAAAKLQQKADPKFLEMLNSSLANLQKHLRPSD